MTEPSRHLTAAKGGVDGSCSFEMARRVVRGEWRRSWMEEWGTLYVAPFGTEDATHGQVIVGAKESIVDGDWKFVERDAPLVLIGMVTGRISRHNFIANFERMDRMTDVGDWPAEGEGS